MKNWPNLEHIAIRFFWPRLMKPTSMATATTIAHVPRSSSYFSVPDLPTSVEPPQHPVLERDGRYSALAIIVTIWSLSSRWDGDDA
jgi:hypothetical protein